MNNEKRAKFLRIYANIPDKLRNDIIIVVDGKTYTWDTSYFEIKEDTELGKRGYIKGNKDFDKEEIKIVEESLN